MQGWVGFVFMKKLFVKQNRRIGIERFLGILRARKEEAAREISHSDGFIGRVFFRMINWPLRFLLSMSLITFS